MTQGISMIYLDGKPITSSTLVDACWIESVDLELSDAELYVDALKAEFQAKKVSDATLQIGWKNRHEDETVWLEPVKLTDLDPVYFTRFSGRYLRLRIEDPSPSQLWKFSALELFGHKAGGRL